MIKLFFIGLLSLLIGCSTPTSNNHTVSHYTSNYADSLNHVRTENDKELKTDPRTPLEAEKVAAFTGLKYFKPNKKWTIHAVYVKIDTASVFNLPTTTERVIPMIKDGLIRFNMNGKTIELFTYRYLEHPEEDLFVPFLDLTNGDVTYGGGRYIEVKHPVNDSVWIDFNMAYNPYCAYNHKYSCPIPPLENTLNISVLAGEKVLYRY